MFFHGKVKLSPFSFDGLDAVAYHSLWQYVNIAILEGLFQRDRSFVEGFLMATERERGGEVRNLMKTLGNMILLSVYEVICFSWFPFAVFT